ncbi:MAG: GNA1162 family protein [bacterium]
MAKKQILLRQFLSIFIAGFLLSSLGCQPVKTKTALDRIYELDPKGKIYVSPKLREKIPKKIAILPFQSLVGEGRIEGSRFLYNLLAGKEKALPNSSMAEKMRRAFLAQFAQLEFDLLRLAQVDNLLKKEGLDSWEKIRATPPHHLGNILGADALIFGQVTHFDYYYGFLYAQLAVGLSMQMVEAESGEILWRVKDARRDHTVRVVLDPLGLFVGLFQVGFALRPINMMRAMDEICREVVGTFPLSADIK